MNTCIYYDLDDVPRCDVLNARARAPGAREFIARGAGWPMALDGPYPYEVPGPREFGYQEEVSKWTDGLIAALEQSASGSRCFQRHRASLFEPLRYRLPFDIADEVQRWRVYCEIAQAGARRILWVAPRARRQTVMGLSIGSAEIEFLGATGAAREPGRIMKKARRIARISIDFVMDFAARLTRGVAQSSLKPHAPILFVEYFPNSALVLVPVAEALKKAHGVEVLWLAARGSVKTALDASGVSSIGLSTAAPRALHRRDHFGPESRDTLQEALDRLPDELFFGTGHVAGRAYLSPLIHQQLVALLGEAAIWNEAFDEAFARLRPRCVVSTTYSSIVGRAAALAAGANDARSVYVQHGILADRDSFTYFCSDVLLLWGDANRRTVERAGNFDGKMNVVGATIYDDLIRRTQQSPPRSFPKPGEPIRVAYMASRSGGLAVGIAAARKFLLTIVEAVAQVPNAHLTVKLHPGDNTGMVEALLRDSPQVAIVRDGNSQDVICECDLAIVVSSTTGLEACVAGRPLIELQAAGVPEYGPYEQYGAALQVALYDHDSPRRLAEAIESLTTKPERLAALAEGRRRLIDDLLNGGSGDATDLAAKVIADMATWQGAREAGDAAANTRIETS